MSSTEKKFKTFSLVTYAEPNDVTEILQSKFDDGSVSAYAHILHDLDLVKNDVGELVRKTPHTHIVLTTTTHRTLTSVINWFKGTVDFNGKRANTLGQTTRTCVHKDGTIIHEPIDLGGATCYLVHEDKDGKPLDIDDPAKHHYNWAEVTSCNLEMLKNPPQAQRGRAVKDDKTFEILQELMNGTNPFILAQKYGRDFILNYRKYCDVAYACSQFGEMERIKKEQEENTYKEFSRGLYDLTEDGAVVEMDIAIREQNQRLKENNAKLMDEVVEPRAKLIMTEE